MPIATDSSPFSIFVNVERLIRARSASNAIGSRRRRRASLMSCPSLRRARFTGIGNGESGCIGFGALCRLTEALYNSRYAKMNITQGRLLPIEIKFTFVCVILFNVCINIH